MYDLKILAAPDQIDEDHERRVAYRVNQVLERHAESVRRVVVRLELYQAPGGLRVPACRVWVERKDGRAIRTRGRGRTYKAAIDRAAERLGKLWQEGVRDSPLRSSDWALAH